MCLCVFMEKTLLGRKQYFAKYFTCHFCFYCHREIVSWAWLNSTGDSLYVIPHKPVMSVAWIISHSAVVMTIVTWKLYWTAYGMHCSYYVSFKMACRPAMMQYTRHFKGHRRGHSIIIHIYINERATHYIFRWEP